MNTYAHKLNIYINMYIFKYVIGKTNLSGRDNERESNRLSRVDRDESIILAYSSRYICIYIFKYAYILILKYLLFFWINVYVYICTYIYICLFILLTYKFIYLYVFMDHFV